MRRARARPTGRSTRTSSSTATPTTSPRTWRCWSGSAPPTLQPLPDRLGRGVLDAVPDVQALQPVRRRHVRPDGDPLAGRDRRQGRDPPPVPPLHRHRLHGAGRVRAGDARHLPRGQAAPAGRGLDALLLRLRRGTDGEEGAVLRDARHPRDLEGRLEGLGDPRPDQRQGRLRERRLGPVPHRRGPLGVEEPGRGDAREAPGADRGWFEQAKENFVLPLDDRTPVELTSIQRPMVEPIRDRYVYYPGATAVPESVAVSVRGRSYKIVADARLDEGARASCSPTAPGSVGTRCSSRTTSCTTSTTSWASLRSRSSSPPRSPPVRTPSASSSSGRAPASTASRSARRSSTSMTAWSPRAR